MNKNKIILLLVALLAQPTLSFSQYFQRLQDYDSTYDWGLDIHLKSDGTLFVFGTLFENNFQWDLFNMTISMDGSTVLNKNLLRFDTASLYFGLPGETKMLSNGTVMTPFTIQTPKNDSTLYSNVGLLKYDALGDTVFYKTYTDTSIYYDCAYSYAILPNSDVLIGGGRSLHINSEQGLLIRTDSLGDTLWTHTYPEITGDEAWFTRLIPISNNRVAASALNQTVYWCCGSGATYNAYYHYDAIFMILDSMGNVLKDTVYGRRYSAGGNLFPDRLGGYMQFGWIDSIANDTGADANDFVNFPYYIAHLDTNFRMDWQIELYSDNILGRRGPWQIKQLQDGNFIVLGDEQTFAIWGLAFKPETDDIRDAPSVELISELLTAGANVRVFDPEAMENVKQIFGAKLSYVENQYEALEGACALIVVTEWSEFRNPDFQRIAKALTHPCIFDGRNVYSLDKMQELGFYYESIGRRTIHKRVHNAAPQPHGEVIRDRGGLD